MDVAGTEMLSDAFGNALGRCDYFECEGEIGLG